MEEKDYDVFRERKQDKRERERECVCDFLRSILFFDFFSLLIFFKI
jgi:hypothetical protein